MTTAERLSRAIAHACRLRGDPARTAAELQAEGLALPRADQIDLAEHFEAVAITWARIRGVPSPIFQPAARRHN
jgi:hypothetical protein